MFSSKLSVAVHILSLIARNKDDALSSEWIAGSINTNPVVVRKIMTLLRKADIINTTRGTSFPTLNKEPKDISLLDVYKAVEERQELFDIHQNTNQQCIVGRNIQNSLDEQYNKVKTKMEAELMSCTLDDVVKCINKDLKIQGELK
ncbi:MAG: Rrf2 family transcriptional regulator [Campylobacteraceae bacterium]